MVFSVFFGIFGRITETPLLCKNDFVENDENSSK